MNTDIALWNIVLNMPDSLKTELLHYAEYLLTKNPTIEAAKDECQQAKAISEKRPLAGSMKGTFVLPLAADFDEPLEDFEEYM